jgi:hypothetical protein
MDGRVYSLLLERALDKSWASNGLPLWLHYSGYQTSCHSMNTLNYALKSIQKNSLAYFMLIPQNYPGVTEEKLGKETYKDGRSLDQYLNRGLSE